MRNLYLESLGISKQSLSTLLRFRGFLWIFIGSSLSVENIEISLYAQARQSLLVLTQGNIYNRLRFLNKYLMFLEELNDLFRENWSSEISDFRVSSFLKTVPGCRVSRHFQNKDRSNVYKLTKIGTVRILSLQSVVLKEDQDVMNVC